MFRPYTGDYPPTPKGIRDWMILLRERGKLGKVERMGVGWLNDLAVPWVMDDMPDPDKKPDQNSPPAGTFKAKVGDKVREKATGKILTVGPDGVPRPFPWRP